MKSALFAIATGLLCTLSAQAHTHNQNQVILADEVGPTVDTMTCAEAKSYAHAHGRYWVHAAGNDIVPIFPVVEDPSVMHCPSKDFYKPIFERTLDSEDCVLSWHCGS